MYVLSLRTSVHGTGASAHDSLDATGGFRKCDGEQGLRPRGVVLGFDKSLSSKGNRLPGLDGAVREEWGQKRVVRCAHRFRAHHLHRGEKSKIKQLCTSLSELETKYLSLRQKYFALLDRYRAPSTACWGGARVEDGLEDGSSLSAPRNDGAVRLSATEEALGCEDERCECGRDSDTCKWPAKPESGEFGLERETVRWKESFSGRDGSVASLPEAGAKKRAVSDRLAVSALRKGSSSDWTRADRTACQVRANVEWGDLAGMVRERGEESIEGDSNARKEKIGDGCARLDAGLESSRVEFERGSADVPASKEVGTSARWRCGVVRRSRGQRCERDDPGWLGNEGKRMVARRSQWTYGVVERTGRPRMMCANALNREERRRICSMGARWACGVVKKMEEPRRKGSTNAPLNERGAKADRSDRLSSGFRPIRAVSAVKKLFYRTARLHVTHATRDEVRLSIGSRNPQKRVECTQRGEASGSVCEESNQVMPCCTSASAAEKSIEEDASGAGLPRARLAKGKRVLRTLRSRLSTLVRDRPDKAQQRLSSHHTKSQKSGRFMRGPRKKVLSLLRWGQTKGGKFLQKKASSDAGADETLADAGMLRREKVPDLFARRHGMPRCNGGSVPDRDKCAESCDTVSPCCWAIDLAQVTFVQKLGTGRSASVYLCLWKGKKVAVKVLKQNNSVQELEDFKGEMKIMSSLSSPQIVKFYGASLSPRLCIVLEYCQNGSLFHYMCNSRNPFSWHLLFKFMYEIVRGINTLHQWNPQILHRDLKSLNLLLDTELNLKVCDFGLSRFVLLEKRQKTFYKTRGTYAYYDPEAYRGGGYTAKSDIYSIGIILWEMVCRLICGEYRRPYSEYSSIRHDFQIIVQSSKGLRPTFPIEAPSSMRSLYEACVQDVQDDRPTCEELEIALTSNMHAYQQDTASWDSLSKASVNNF